MRRAKCRQASSRWVWKLACRATPPHSGHTCGALCLWILWWAETAHGLGSIMGGEHCVHVWRKERVKGRHKQQSPPPHGRVLANTIHPHRVGGASDLLEVGDHLRLAGELRLALRTLEVVVLEPLPLFAGEGHQGLRALGGAADRTRLRRRWSRGVLHRARAGGEGGASGGGGRRGD